MSELEKVCRELYDALKNVTDYIDDREERGWDKHIENDFLYLELPTLYPFRERLGELLHIENEHTF
jgi:hypothetical protein